MGKIINKIIDKVVTPVQERKYLERFYSSTRSRKSIEQSVKGKILMYVGIGHMYLTPLEILMYHLLIDEGYEVDYLIYDENVAANEVITKEVIETQGKNKFWKRSVTNARRILKASNVRYIHIQKDPIIDPIISPLKGELNQILGFSYDGIDFGNIVKGVLYRYYKSLRFEDNADQIAYNFLETSLTNYMMVRRLHGQNQYKAVFFSHGIYCTWQPVVDFCHKQQLRFVCYDRAKLAGSCNFNINQPSPDWSFNAAWDRYERRALTANEEQMVSDYLGERELQKGDVYAYNDSRKASDINALKLDLGIPLNRKVITIFTNLIWDAANVSRDIAFDSALDCIIKLIDYYREREDVHIVVRAHPAEKVLGTRERYGSLVRAQYGNLLPSNVTIIDPEMNINSFSVIELSDIGVVNTSTVGLEFAIMAKPIILISETNYRNKGFTYDAQSTEHFFMLSDRLLLEGSLLPRQVEIARKYFFMMMFLYQKRMPLVFDNKRFKAYQYPSFEQRDKFDTLSIMLREFEDVSKSDFIYWE
jgi:hypothetical protein